VLLYGVVPVEVGIVESLAKPGGNVTGSAAISLEMVSKSVELFKSAVPHLRRVTVIANSRDPVAKPTVSESRRTADSLGLIVSVSEANDQASLINALAQLTRDSPDGVLANISASTTSRKSGITRQSTACPSCTPSNLSSGQAA
jgi:putative ABC transport system substrate-binding protein